MSDPLSLSVDPATVKMDNGDTFDEDTGDSLGNLDLSVKELKQEGLFGVQQLPVEISVFLNGFWYVYKLDRKYEDDGEKA